MQTLIRRGVLLAAAILFTACGGDRAEEIKAATPTGTFEGKAWTMAKATVTKEGDRLSVQLFSEAVEDCAEFAPSGSTAGYLLWSMPAQVGKRPLQLSLTDLSSTENQTITFVTPPSSNNISVDGIINVMELTDTSVTFGFIAEAGEGNAVNGTVTATLCK